jgi:hypothetical protein
MEEEAEVGAVGLMLSGESLGLGERPPVPGS